MTGNYFSHLGTLMGFIMVIKQIVPGRIWMLIELQIGRISSGLWWETEVSIPEFIRGEANVIFDIADLYVANLTDTNKKSSANRIQLTRVKNASKPNRNLTRGERIEDKFKGVTFSWTYIVKEPSNDQQSNPFFYNRSRGGAQTEYVVQVHRRFKHTILPEYLEEVLKQGSLLKRQNQDRQLFTNVGSNDGWEFPKRPWRSLPFKHSSTFSSLALEPAMKEKIINDLDSFMAGKDFFDRVGRAWKRGYLLYGPPGTGKSSLIAAIANYTQYDVYDLELTEVRSNADLRKLLMGISNKAIIVIEDIDCSLELKKRGKPAPEGGDEGSGEKKPEDEAKEQKNSRVTLSGLLNFTDGLWSCSGSERIIIFTTNHKEDLDPALLRSGRMDLHILLSYCGFEAFKTLAWTHLEATPKDEGFGTAFGEIEELIGKVEATPADLAEVLIQNRGDARAALDGVIEVLKQKRGEGENEETVGGVEDKNKEE